MRIAWTNTLDGLVLEESDSLGSWQPFPGTLELVNGVSSVMVDLTDAGRFFRLRTMATDVLPPDPATKAPPISMSTATTLAGMTAFLYSGPDPIQTGGAPAVIEAKRAAVVRGRVLRRDNTPLSGAVVSILNHPEFGQTLSRLDGVYDLVLNGGGLVTVRFEKSGFCPVQRQTDVPWQDMAAVPEVVMIPWDPIVTSVALGTDSPLQVHQGSVQVDADGARRATLILPPATTGEIVLPNGSTQPISSLSLRATEFSVGANGPQAMPAELPPNSGYTYCVELSADEAIAVGATDIRFSSPLPFYVENFLGFPVGTTAPLGSYDRTRGVWIAADSGRVVKILSVAGGVAELDLDGDGLADSDPAMAELSITQAERQQLAALYPAGQSLWRVLVPHFSPWDVNWGIGAPDDAEAPEGDPNLWQPMDQCCRQSGNSVIEIPNQILGESVAVVGTSFSLNYQSERVPGRKEAYSLEIPLSGSRLPASLRRIELEISVAGQFARRSFPPSLNQTATFTWDGKNVYGQPMQGKQPITVRIGYTYPTVYRSAQRFGFSGGDGLSPSRTELTLWRTFQGKVGSWDARGNALGGWSLSAHHAYDASEQTLYRGDGGRESARAIPSTISTYAGTGAGSGRDLGDGGPAINALITPEGLVVGPEGSLYIANPLLGLVRRVTPDGIIQTVAGSNTGCDPSAGPCGDGGPATNASLGSPYSLALGADGTLYIGEAAARNHTVRKVSPDGIISRVAGTGVGGFSGDGGPAKLAQISTALGLAVGPDQSVYIADAANRRVRRVTPDGIISTVAGTGVSGFSGDGGPATLAMLGEPRGIAVSRDGSLYIADTLANRVRRVTPDGIIQTVAGNGAFGFAGDGGPALEASFKFPTAVAFAPDATLYIVDQGNFRVRWMRLGGTIQTLAGGDVAGSTGDLGPARQASLQELHTGLAVGPDGAVYVAQDSNNLRVRRITPPSASFLAGTLGEIILPAADGSEVYVFTLNGRHLRTLDALTGDLRYQFSYDAEGRLTEVEDANGNATRIERNDDGDPTAIVGPYGHRTLLELTGEGFLRQITNPAGETVRLTYAADGLLTSLTNPRGNTSSYAYDPVGRLVAATDPAGFTKTLTRSGTDEDFTVTMATSAGQTSAHRVQTQKNGDQRITITACDGSSSQSTIGLDGRLSAAHADGSRADLVLGPDPRWGMRAPIIASLTTTAPGGLTATTTSLSAVTLTDPGDLLHVRSRVESLTRNGRTWTNTYDGTNRTMVSTSPVGRQGRVRLDERGRTAQAQGGTLEPMSFTYDARGRLASATLGQGADARIATFHYGPDGFRTNVTDPLGNSASFTQDRIGRVIAETLPGGRVLGLAYDANSNLRSVTPPGRPAHAFSYDPRDDVAGYTPPAVAGEAFETRFTYDADRRPTRLAEPDGTAVQVSFDGGNCHVTLVDVGARNRTYAFNAAGQVVSMEASQGISLAYAYDRGIVTNVACSGVVNGRVTQTYDSDLRITSLRVNETEPVTFQYDADGLPIAVGGITLTRSEENGFITATTLGAATTSLTYDRFGAPAGLTASHSGTALYQEQITRDPLGRLSQRTETIGGTTRTYDYGYDPAGCLAEVRQDGLFVASYAYDANGNRLSQTGTAGTIEATYDAQDRLLESGAAAYTHNARGERVGKTVGGQTTRYQYDGIGNLLGVTLPDGTQIEYLLDALDRRVGRRVNGTLTQAFLYQDGRRPIAELDGAEAVVSRFVYATGRSVPDYMVRGGATYRIISDHLGSPRLVLDITTGQIAQQIEHDEFGRVTLDTNPGFQPFGFAGGLDDRQTGFVHFGAREYDPETGRWTTKDPIGFGGGDANLYAYALNDPVNNVDPFGLIVPSDKLAIATHPALAAALGYVANRGQATIRGIGMVGARAGNALANVGRAVQNFFCSNPSAAANPGLPSLGSRIPPELAGRIEAIRERIPDFQRAWQQYLSDPGGIEVTDVVGTWTRGNWFEVFGKAPQIVVDLEMAFDELAAALGSRELLIQLLQGFDPGKL